jgi:hypothetical protein
MPTSLHIQNPIHQVAKIEAVHLSWLPGRLFFHLCVHAAMPPSRKMQISTNETDIDSSIEEVEEEAYQDPIPIAEKVQLAVDAYSTALKRWDAYKASLQKGQKCEQKKPSASSIARKFGVTRSTMERRFHGVCKPL